MGKFLERHEEIGGFDPRGGQMTVRIKFGADQHIGADDGAMPLAAE